MQLSQIEKVVFALHLEDHKDQRAEIIASRFAGLNKNTLILEWSDRIARNPKDKELAKTVWSRYLANTANGKQLKIDPKTGQEIRPCNGCDDKKPLRPTLQVVRVAKSPKS